MIEITLKYEDETTRKITFSDTKIKNEEEFVNWLKNDSFQDCYTAIPPFSDYYNDSENEDVCNEFFDMLYKGINIYNWYDSEKGFDKNIEFKVI